MYHGVNPCEMNSDETKKLISTYVNADVPQKKLLEKQYGRRQIQIVVEKHLSTEYIRNNTKSCPVCHTSIEKIDGCNKLQCTHCQAIFCWLCGDHIILPNAYDHFLNHGTECHGRLLEGVVEMNLVDINIEENLWFNEQ